MFILPNPDPNLIVVVKSYINMDTKSLRKSNPCPTITFINHVVQFH